MTALPRGARRRTLLLGAAPVAMFAALLGCGDDGPDAGRSPVTSPASTGVTADGGATTPISPVVAPMVGDSASGESAFVANGCNGCHTTNGARLAGPTLQGLAGSDVALTDGTTVTADAAYLSRSIADPGVEVVDGFSSMPEYGLDEATIADIVAYIQSVP